MLGKLKYIRPRSSRGIYVLVESLFVEYLAILFLLFNVLYGAKSIPRGHKAVID